MSHDNSATKPAIYDGEICYSPQLPSYNLLYIEHRDYHTAIPEGLPSILSNLQGQAWHSYADEPPLFHEESPAILSHSGEHLAEAHRQRFIDECYAQVSTSDKEKGSQLAALILNQQLCSPEDMGPTSESHDVANFPRYKYVPQYCCLCARTTPRYLCSNGGCTINSSLPMGCQQGSNCRLTREDNHRDHLVQCTLEYHVDYKRKLYKEMGRHALYQFPNHGEISTRHHNCRTNI